jgi:succinate-semialdehyde dehydrogenase/glutarate-semialdehyde dehydrogenase
VANVILGAVTGIQDVPTAAGEIRVVDPARLEEIARYEPHTDEQIESALEQAHAAQRRWSELPVETRSAPLRETARILRERRDEYAELMVREMGKPIGEARAEIEKCATGCDYYAENAARFLAERVIESTAQRSWAAYEPLGVVLAIMPWNFPFWQALRFAAPALAAGNGALLKHAPNVSGCALAVEALFAQAGFPDGLFRSILVAPARVGEVTERLIADPRIAAVTLTGSERAGMAVAAAAGRALKKSVLELGGSDPLVVLEDADLPTVAAAIAKSRYMNAGQVCIAPKRVIAPAAVYDELERLVVEAVEALTVGDPLDAATQVGPLAREDLLENLERQIEATVGEGARLLTGGRRLDRPGHYFAPTVLGDVRPGMTAFAEETFGPVAALVRAADEHEAIELANDTPYGLAASVWTGDPQRGLEAGRRLRSGALFVNGVVASDPRLPFGGTRRSGYGRELSEEGIREFTNLRTYWVGT